MYRIILKNGDTETTVLDYSQKKYILDGKVERESNKSDLLSFSVDHSFDKSLIKEYKTLATVYDENDVIFRGRTVTNQRDLYNTFTVEFEGALSFLNDSQYPPFEFTGTPKELFESVINNHNSQVEDFKKLKIGNCTVTDPNDYLPRSSESYMSSLEILKDRLVKSLGGFLIVRYENDGNYIDYLESIEDTSEQKIKLNENLIDIDITVDKTNIITILIPFGATDDETGITLDVSSVNGGKIQIENADAIAEYGRIYGKAKFENVTVASNLLTKAQAYLNQRAIPTTTITLTAVDMHMIDSNIEKFKLNQWVEVESELHDIDTHFMLSKITYDLLNPENNKITLGTVEQGLSDSASSDIAAIESSLAGVSDTLVYQNMKINGKLDVNIFEAFKATIEDLDVTHLSVKVAEIEQAYISKAQVEQLYATKADFNILSTNVAEIEQAYIDDIEAIEAQIAVITAGQITAGYIEANYAKIDLSNIENGCITTAMIGVGVVDTAQIADAAVTDAKIVGMTANKITAGTIDAAQIEVVNLNAANITVGTINGVQIANGAIDMNKLSDALSTKITDTEEDVQQALIDVGLAQTDATQALEDALEAFQKAQEALSSASAAQTTANGKNTIFYQTSAPSTSGRKTNDIWYDIDDDYKMYYFNGTSWVGVEFGENAIADGIITSDKIASEVSSKINQAFTNAEQAIEDSSDALSTAEAVNLIVEANKANWDKASTALTTANGKNTIYYQSSQPSTSGKKTNDIWFDTANGYRMYYFNGTSWVAAQFGVNAIADNAVTADKIADSVNSAIAKAQTDATKGITDAASALEAIDNLEIGGRNYIQLKKLNSYRSYNTVPTYSGNVITSTFNTSGSNKQYFFTLSIIGYTPSNDVYTLSGYLKVNDAIPTKNLFVDLASTHGGNLIRNEYDSTTGYFVITQTYPGNSAWIMHCKTTWTGGTADVVTLTKLKFEKGNRATDWTPAPEDTDSAITTAQATADGKNTVFYQTSAPSTSNRKTNDIWFDTDDGNKPYYWNGSSWTAQQFGTSAIKNLAITNALIADGTIQNAKISNLDAAKITTGTLAADRIGARTIAASKLIANTITADSGVIANAAIKSAMIVDAAIGTAKIADAAVTNAKIANLAVTNAKIADATIASAKIASLDAGKITSGYISAARIQAGTITADKLKADTITAASGVIADAAILTANIADLAVSSGKIANAAIGTAKIADLAVTNAKLANLAVTNAKIADATIQSAKIAALDAGKITSGYISSDRIAAGSLVIGKLDSSTQSLINNSQKLFQTTIDLSASTYNVNNYYPVVGTAIPSGSSGYHRFIVAVQLNSGTKPSWSTHTYGFTCNLDVEVKASGWGTTNANGWINDNSFRFCDKMPATFYQMTNSSLPVFYLRGGGKYYVKTDYSCSWSIKTSTYTSNSQSVAPTTSPPTHSGLANHWTINTAIANWCYNNDRTYINGGKIYTGTVAAAQIAASAITAEKIATNAVIAAKIAAGAITSDKLSANSVVAGKIAANAVTTGTIAADAVNADKIAANAILAEHIKAGVITGDKLVAATITGAKIAASTITANNIAAGTITAAKIASGTITATQIASGTITATQLASNSVTAVKIAASAVTADKIAANAVTAAKIATDAIKSRNYVANSTGSYLNLSDGSFSSKNLKWDANGNLTATNGSFTGTINSTAGTIAGFTINSSGLTVSKTITNGTLSMKINNGGTIIISQVATNNNMSTSIDVAGISIKSEDSRAYYSDNKIIMFHPDNSEVFQILRYEDNSTAIKAANELYVSSTNKGITVNSGLGLDVVCKSGGINLTTSNGTGIEIYTSIPFIDFHANKLSSDYTHRLLAQSGGAIIAYPSVANGSDRRLKKDFEPIEDRYLTALRGLKPTKYRYIKSDKVLNLGFIAQEVESTFKSLGINDVPMIQQDELEGYYTLDYSGIATLGIYGWQKHDEEINKLKAEIDLLRAQLNAYINGDYEIKGGNYS